LLIVFRIDFYDAIITRTKVFRLDIAKYAVLLHELSVKK